MLQNRFGHVRQNNFRLETGKIIHGYSMKVYPGRGNESASLMLSRSSTDFQIFGISGRGSPFISLNTCLAIKSVKGEIF